MPRALRVSIFVSFCLSIPAWIIAGSVSAVPVVWSGPTLTFTKNVNIDPTAVENQDHLTDNVILARGFNQGMYNIATETGYNGNMILGPISPEDTEWATHLVGNNSGKTISAIFGTTLDFTTWAAAYGGPGSALSSHITADTAVVHLITEDIYLDLKFTQFTSGGFFQYQRSSPAPSGDYNGNHIVDAADYTVWRDTLGQTVPNGTGADGNADGTINPADYTFWKSHFGNPAPGMGSGAGATVPEPATIILVIAGFSTFLSGVGRQCAAKRAARRTNENNSP
jgi:hypothetical protein